MSPAKSRGGHSPDMAPEGLQPERTALAWSRTSFAVLGNGALLMAREMHGAQVAGQIVAVCLAAAVALLIYLVGARRQRLLRRRPRPVNIAARREVQIVGWSIAALIVATTLTLPF